MTIDLGTWGVKKIRQVLHSIRRQAPGARMVGEFAVKVASRDVARRLGVGGRTDTELRKETTASVDPTTEASDGPTGA